jgi:sugar-specific transcriptional regulator TrmB
MAINDLKEYGLSNKESKVYLALLELGPSSVTEIAFKSKINRTTAYDILAALEQYGLVSHVGEQKKRTYVAENPERLISFLDKKSQELKSKATEIKEIMPELKGMFNLIPRKPLVKYFEGEEGILSIYEDSLNSKTEILSWLNTENTADFAAEYFEQYYKRRAAKGIHIKAIVNDVPISHEIDQRNKAEDREMRIIPSEMMNIGPECYIYDDKVAYMSLKEKFGVIVESKDIADAQRKLYNLAWRASSDLKSK